MEGQGLALYVPPVVIRLRSPLKVLGLHLQSLYRDYPLLASDEPADIAIRMIPNRPPLRWTKPQVQFVVDGVTPFEPFPLDHALPMFEWGLNWVFGHRMHHYLLLHSAVVESQGKAILLPAWPGSGKSTLSASLSLRGWRFLSDEFGVVSLSASQVFPFPRPVALKNESIEVMRRFEPNAYIGPIFPKTRKGNVAHLRVPEQSVQRAAEPSKVAAVVFPNFKIGAELSVQQLGKATAFLKLAGNAFNYEVVGEPAFRAVAQIIHRCESYVLTYGNLVDAHAALADILSRAPEE